MEIDFTLTQSSAGMAQGMVYQFAEGRWREGLGRGVVMSTDAYDFLEPVLDHACPDVSDQGRYGVAELDPEMCMSFAAHLRRAAEHVRSARTVEQIEINSGAVRVEELRCAFEKRPEHYSALANLFSRLADWLEDAAKHNPVVSLVGL